MPRARYGLTWGALCALGLLTAACAGRVPPATVDQAAPAAVAVQETPAQASQPQTDPVTDLIGVSNQHFENGRRELDAGHLEAAKTAFNRALEVLLESPGGTRADPRLREQFDRTVGRISAYELTALAQGDGFTEKTSEPASIDDLLGISTFEPLPAATPETANAVAQDLQAVIHDIDIPLNARVLSYVQLFTGRLKGYLEEGLSRGAQYLPMIQEVFRAEGLPLDLAYVPLIESAFKPNALSRAKAKGIWQFMRGTGLENGLKHDWYIDERSDPEKATRAAAKYLKTLHGMFDDWHLALASYNGGPGRVQRAIKRSGRDDFWKLTANKKYLPRETRDYVPLILAAVIIARSPEQYGMNIEPIDKPVYETVTLPNAVDLRRVAEWAGTPVQTIQELNPELRRWTTPLRATDYELKVPDGTAALVNARMGEIAPDELTPLNHHIVRKGETLLSIAKKLKVSRADLAEANYLSSKASLKTGQQLVIPRAPTLLLAARTDTPLPAVDLPAVVDAVPASNTIATRPGPKIDAVPAKMVHRVKRGETLYSIAKRYDTTVVSLKEWNRLRSNSIQVGQRLTIVRDPDDATN
ncbi:MAG TPA: LysM peptidoglycan-binding domain-containing protein [Vicinamibacterales bacterium]|nr:LysM peptidoglycan-binding domain-containing protein [Vicinamibacterales bacterium]